MFLSTGEADEIAESDFDALWVVMDADDSGKVDFLEFCAFVGQCHDEYDTARLDRGAMAHRISQRALLAETTARRLSGISSRAMAVPIEEEGDEEEAA